MTPEELMEIILNIVISILIIIAIIIFGLCKGSVDLAWSIPSPYLEVIPFWLIGAVSEFRYTGRLTIFSNSMALILFFKEHHIDNVDIQAILYLYLGVGLIMGIIGLIAYTLDIQLSGRRYYKVGRYFYGSITTGAILILGYLISSQTISPPPNPYF